MKLIVGLGNPGRKYVGTRHNIGWEVLAGLVRQCGGGAPRERFQGEVVDVDMGGQKALLLCPLTYMNLSGASVQPARDFHKIDNVDLIVVCDDFNLPLAKLRFRPRGSAGGQKGLQNIIQRLGTDEFPRLRMGIGSPPPNWEAVNFVLSKFTGEERVAMDSAVATAVQALRDWVEHGVEFCMNQYNCT
jgi:PTH1 family peptidyl-tRNA hydrolase